MTEDEYLLNSKIESDLLKARNSLSTDRLDMSFGEIISMYERGEMIINPEFQRLFRWTKQQQTLFIESLLLGIPIPSIFVAEDNSGRWEIVDGLQRISTVLSFFGKLVSFPEKNNLTLLEGDIITSLQGYDSQTLPLKLNLNIKRASCRIEIIKWNSNIDMRYQLFKRLNTGGSPLTDQEIRNCIFRGTSSKFNDFLKKMASNEKFIQLIKPTQRQIDTLYLEELVLRFASLVEGKWEYIQEDFLSKHMSNYMKITVENEDYDYEHLENLFTRIINVLYPLGDGIFRGMNGVFSSGFFDGIMIGTSLKLDFYESNEDVLSQKINKLITDTEFRKYIGSASGSKYNVTHRIEIATTVFGFE
jgi:uncharacterized protein with ParB-like and HNH nuclease domain